MDVESFLASCKQSGNQAYANFKDLLTRLNDVNTRAEARRFLSLLEEKTGLLPEEEAMKEYNFRIHQLKLSDIGDRAGLANGSAPPTSSSGVRQTLTLLEMSSIFIPEEWSFTFYEGLTRHPDIGFRDRDVAELGCGNGWISIALAERFSPRKVYGVDINPRAIKIAWINLYLNALNGDGSPVVDHEGATLLDRVEFHESDLLSYIRDNGIMLDRVVGCIPQVLTPDPKATLKMVSETMSEEFLYSLSNYCSLQGYVEDQFGLGLIARAVEESIEVVKSTGAIILNMGGRPGQAVCERLFLRRGFCFQKLWQTRVFQAQDTDITPLVEIERDSRHRFEFFMGPVSEEPISARTAYAYAAAGGRIAHGLTVYECRLRQPNQVKDIFRFLQQKGFEDTRSAVDLSFTDEAVADEKLAFLAHLARTLGSSQGALATHDEPPAGSLKFRSQIASFLRLYFRIPLSAQNVVVVPTRATAIENLLRLYAPPLALVDAGLTRSLPRAWLSSLPNLNDDKQASSSPVVLQAPRRVDLLVKLVRALKPQMVIASLADFEARTASPFLQLLDVSAEVGARLFLDISDHVELSSMPATNGVLQFLAENALPAHAGIICSLIKNQVYSDLEVAFVVSESEVLLDTLASAGELTYFRAPLMKQLYYGCLLDELLSFQIPDRHVVDTRPLQKGDGNDTPGSKLVSINNGAIDAFAHPAIKACHLAAAAESASPKTVVRMDVTPSGVPTPPVVQRFMFEAFVRQHVSEAEMDPRPELLQLLAQRFCLSPENTSVVTGNGSCSLVSQLLAACAGEGGTAVFPAGSFGSFVAAAKFFGIPVVFVPTEASDSFKLRADKLDETLKVVQKPWLVLSAPIVNPTGALYTDAELTSILGACRTHGARVILDTYFSGMRFPEEGGDGKDEAEQIDLESDIAANTAPPSSRFSVAIIGEISPKLSLGGVLFGFAAVRDTFFKEALANVVLPHGTTRYAVKKIVAAMVSKDDTSQVKEEITVKTKELGERAKKLTQVLKETGWEPIPPKGGNFLVASPKAFEGKSVTYDLPGTSGSGTTNKTAVLSSETVPEALFATTGLLINDSTWTSIPGFCRFVFSLEREKFEAGLEKLRQFHRTVLG